MESKEGKLETELKEKIFHLFKDFMTRVTKLEELGTVGNRLLSGFQQGLEFLRRPPINSTSELIKNIIKANETKRFQSYFEAGCINSHDGVQHMSKFKSILNELECLLGDVADVMQTTIECLVHVWDKDFSNGLDQQAMTDEEEKTSSRLQELEMTDYAALAGIIYSMVKQDFVMQERIITSLSLTSSSGELESYCLMWSLRPFIIDEVMHQAWRLIP